MFMVEAEMARNSPGTNNSDGRLVELVLGMMGEIKKDFKETVSDLRKEIAGSADRFIGVMQTYDVANKAESQSYKTLVNEVQADVKAFGRRLEEMASRKDYDKLELKVEALEKIVVPRAEYERLEDKLTKCMEVQAVNVPIFEKTVKQVDENKDKIGEIKGEVAQFLAMIKGGWWIAALIGTLVTVVGGAVGAVIVAWLGR